MGQGRTLISLTTPFLGLVYSLLLHTYYGHFTNSVNCFLAATARLILGLDVQRHCGQEGTVRGTQRSHANWMYSMGTPFTCRNPRLR